MNKTNILNTEKIALSEFINSEEYQFMTDSLEGTIINEYASLNSLIEHIYTQLAINPFSLNIKTIDDKTETYKSLDITQINQPLEDIYNFINKANYKLEEDKKRFLRTHEENLKDSTKSINAFKNIGIKLRFGESLTKFKQKNNQSIAYTVMSKEGKEELHTAIEVAHQYEKIHNELINTMSSIKADIRTLENKTENLENIFELIIKLQNEEIALSEDQVESNIIKLLLNEINYSRALKNIYVKPNIQQNNNNIIKINTIDKIITNNIKDIKEEQEPRKTYDLNQLLFLETRGLKTNEAKTIIDSNEYSKVKNFILSLEKIIIEKKVDPCEIKIIYTKNKELLMQDTKNMSEYLELIEQLYDIYDPKKVSGILPKYNPEIYFSLANLSKYITLKQSKESKLSIEGIELITSTEDKDTFNNKINTNIFQNKPITKYVSGKAKGKKTAMYEKYCLLGGEGHYRTAELGFRRAVYKIENTGTDKQGIDTHKVKIVAYFDTHNKYSQFFKTRD